MQMDIIARIRSDFPSKFGIPRQSGLAKDLISTVVFEEGYRDENALRGIEQFSHLWLIWVFSANEGAGWSATVRPPKLGGNVRMGVFATRSPFRPNPIGLSSVRLEGVEKVSGLGTVLRVSGADLMDGTPILDIKPYIPASDLHADATGGFSEPAARHHLTVNFPQELLEIVPEDKRAALIEILAQDPRPGYQHDPERVYGFAFANLELRFRVCAEVLTVTQVNRTAPHASAHTS